MTESIVHASLSNVTSTCLLRLHSSADLDSELYGTLFEVDISADTIPDYEFLSYTWGEPDPMSTVSLNNVELSIRLNLAQALRRLRLPAEDRVLWADALCISQHDLTEKAQQVKMIGEIVKSARRTLAWVGEHRNDSEILFNHDREESLLLKSGDMQLDVHRPKDPFVTSLEHRMDRKTLMRIWAEFLYYRHWWNRTWCVQEVAVAKDVVVCCGLDSRAWDDLLNSAPGSWLIHNQDVDFPSVDSGSFEGYREESDPVGTEDAFVVGCTRVRRLTACRSRYANDADHVVHSQVGSLRSFGDSTIGTLCLDRRDKVYAILSLVKNAALREKIQVDYKCSIWKLGLRVLKALLPDVNTDLAPLMSYWGEKGVAFVLEMKPHERRHLVDLIFAEPIEMNAVLVNAANDMLRPVDKVNIYDLDFQYTTLPQCYNRAELELAAERKKEFLFTRWAQTRARRQQARKYSNHDPECHQCVADLDLGEA